MVGHIKSLKDVHFSGNVVKNASMKVLVGQEEGWPNHVMRIIEVGEDGHTPKHEHPWPHINYFIEGQGVLEIGGVMHPVEEGSYAYVPGHTLHQFRNTSTQTLRFICIVPSEGHKY